MPPELYDYPELYDALLPAGAHISYYLELARQAPGDVLELACGTGQLTLPIAGAGVSIVGLDLSAPMLKVAAEHAARAKVVVEYAQGDMRDFDLGRKFALIFIGRNSLLHMHSAEDLMAAFAAVRRHLAPGGVFAFDIFNPNVRLLARPAGQRFPAFEKQTDAFGKLSVEETMDYDAATQVGRALWYVSTETKADAWVLPLDLRNIFPQELPLLLAAGGFDLTSRASDFQQTPFHSASRMQVCLCHAKSVHREVIDSSR